MQRFRRPSYNQQTLTSSNEKTCRCIKKSTKVPKIGRKIKRHRKKGTSYKNK